MDGALSQALALHCYLSASVQLCRWRSTAGHVAMRLVDGDG